MVGLGIAFGSGTVVARASFINAEIVARISGVVGWIELLSMSTDAWVSVTSILGVGRSWVLGIVSLMHDEKIKKSKGRKKYGARIYGMTGF
ncbi:MAG: hypothetical protein CL891_01290 [Dehalococcoidia bacterium]|nr:hypothetical protein [Dehalococcoidia bacterium]|tara:strand:+ start:212 stop:484 length:273 start_codon:yes stop_codon:yes gene_type:complete